MTGPGTTHRGFDYPVEGAFSDDVLRFWRGRQVGLPEPVIGDGGDIIEIIMDFFDIETDGFNGEIHRVIVEPQPSNPRVLNGIVNGVTMRLKDVKKLAPVRNRRWQPVDPTPGEHVSARFETLLEAFGDEVVEEWYDTEVARLLPEVWGRRAKSLDLGVTIHMHIDTLRDYPYRRRPIPFNVVWGGQMRGDGACGASCWPWSNRVDLTGPPDGAALTQADLDAFAPFAAWSVQQFMHAFLAFWSKPVPPLDLWERWGVIV